MKYELGNLMAESPDTEALTLLGYRLAAMQKEVAQLRDERDEARKLARYYRNISCDSQEESDEQPLPWE
jgi:hypothetical protein